VEIEHMPYSHQSKENWKINNDIRELKSEPFFPYNDDDLTRAQADLG
jgi:hypothetical protein